MKNLKLNTLKVAISAACFGLLLNTAQAAELVNFSNGTVADANDVNHNFTELATRISNVSLTTGPKGDSGTNGADGIDGVPGKDGTGITSYSWQGYGANSWSQKTFIVTQSNGTSYDKEVRSFDRSTLGFPVMTRERFTGATKVKKQVLHFEINASGFLFNQIDNYFTLDGGATFNLTNTVNISPGINTRNKTMVQGMTWGTASQITRVNQNGDPDFISFANDTRSLLAIEDITVQGTAYTDCQKIFVNRASTALGKHFQEINWFCPAGTGLVKSILIRSAGNGSDSRMLELDAANSVRVPAT